MKQKKLLNNRPAVFAAVGLMSGVYVGALSTGSLLLEIFLPLLLAFLGVIFYLLTKKSVFLVVFLSFAFGICILLFDNVTHYGNIKYALTNSYFFTVLRSRIYFALFRYLSAENAGFAYKLMLGYNAMTYEDITVFRQAGIIHVFALSGLHVGFLLAVVYFILRKVKAGRRTSMLVTALVVSFYAILTSFPAGVMRAGIMALVYSYGFIKHRRPDPLSTLAFSCAVILLIEPRALFEWSFVMSAAAVLGIILFYRPLSRLFRGRAKSRFRKYIADGAATTVAANIFLFPIMVLIFDFIATFAVVTNLIVLPIAAVVYSYLFFVIILSIVSVYFGALAIPASFPITAIRAVAKLITVLPYSTLPVPAVSYTGIFLFIFGAIIISDKIFIKKLPKYVMCGTMIIVSIVCFAV